MTGAGDSPLLTADLAAGGFVQIQVTRDGITIPMALTPEQAVMFGAVLIRLGRRGAETVQAG